MIQNTGRKPENLITWRTWLAAAIITLAIIGVATALTSCMPNYSDGEWVGTVTKLSHKGLFFKSWEGQIVIGGVRSKTTVHRNSSGEYTGTSKSAITNAYEFNVSDSAVVHDVEKALNTGQTVKLHYHQWAFSPPWIDNDHVVDHVTFMEESE